MSDDLNKKGKQDREQINIHEPYELNYWSKKFNVLKSKLISTVKKAGTFVKAVKKLLS